MRNTWRFGTVLAAAAVAVLLAARPASAAVYKCASGDVACLISSINAANADPGSDTIVLAGGIYSLTAGDNDVGWGPTGLPVISTPVTILGAGRSSTIIQRDGNLAMFRIFHVSLNGNLTLQDLTVQRGFINELLNPHQGESTLGGGGILNFGQLSIFDCAVVNNVAEFSSTPFGGGLAGGAGIRNETTGSLYIVSSVVSGNDAEQNPGGGGILNAGSMTAAFCLINGNRTDQFTISGGGGILNTGGAIISYSTISGNFAGFHGGGIYADGAVTIDSSTISGNDSTGNSTLGGGGGIAAYGAVTVRNTTLSGNDGLVGGGLWVKGGHVTLTNVTVADNQADLGAGGVVNLTPDDRPEGWVHMENSILARNTFSGSGVAADCGGEVLSLGHSIVEDRATCDLVMGPGDVIGNAGLGTFTDDGTPGHGYVTLLPASAAIDGANPSTAPPSDQLGRSRVDGNVDGATVADIGAAEFKTPVVNALVTLYTSKSVLSPTPVKGGPAGTLTIAATLTNVSGEPIYAPYLILRSVNGGAMNLTADQPPGGVGSRQTLKVGSDNTLTAGEKISFTITFGLQQYAKPSFVFDTVGGAGATTP